MLTYQGRIYNGIHPENICNVPVELVREMPMNSGTLVHISTREPGKNIDTISPIRIARFDSEISRHQPHIKETLRIIPSDEPDFIMEAMVFDVSILKKILGSEIFNRLREEDRLIGFKIEAKKNGRYHRAIRASEFIPWALKVLEKPDVKDFIISDYEVGSDTHKQFMKAYDGEEINENTFIEAKKRAMRATWGHKQIEKAGFKLMEDDNSVGFYFLNTTDKQALVYGIYERK